MNVLKIGLRLLCVMVALPVWFLITVTGTPFVALGILYHIIWENEFEALCLLDDLNRQWTWPARMLRKVW